MNKLLAFFTLLCCLFSCRSNIEPPKKDSLEESQKRLDKKLYPYYERDLIRAFPDTVFNVTSYERGKKEVQEDIKQLQKKANGFDLPWVVQGPGNLGARINTLAVDPQNSDIMYVGFAGGGLWRTMDGGNDWQSIFDSQVHNSIGDIAIDPKNPNIIYVGTGDPNVPGRAFIGSGLFRSVNRGENWENIGLVEQKVIPQVVLHPEDPTIIYAASMGLPYSKNATRGLFISKNNGLDWEKIFYVSDSTGICDFKINPEQPNMMYAATWDRVRSNSINIAHGEGSGIYVSEDSGVTWQTATGIPDTSMCKTGIDICQSQPNNVYAILVDAERNLGGIYHSTDYGKTFGTIPTEQLKEYGVYSGFGWYFGKIFVDPNDPQHLYVSAVDLWETTDGGQNWFEACPPWWQYVVHADKHDLYFGKDSTLILATDGGLFQGKISDVNNWNSLEDIPTTQFYRVAYNPHRPDLYYGGAQDNGSTGGKLSNINDWERIFGGDGFQMMFDPEDPDHYFVETQFGGINVTWDNGASYERATEGLSGNKNWDLPYIMSPHNRNIMYAGTDKVYKSLDSYELFWEPISDDLTAGGPPTQLSITISSISESPVNEGIIYAGCSNGLIHITADGGDSWKLISTELPDRYVTSVKASPSDSKTAYVTISGYKENEFLPRVYRTDNMGSSWTNISSGLPDIAVNDILVLPGYDDQILFVATDGGIYGSVDGAMNWERLGVGMPNLVCYDMVYNVENMELVVGTFGRSIMTYPIQEILDPVSNSELVQQDLITVSPTLASAFIDIQILNNNHQLNGVVRLVSNTGKEIMKSYKAGRLDISSVPSGIYYVHYQEAQKFQVIPIVIN